MGRFLNYASTFPITTFCLSEVCLWVEYANVILRRLPIFRHLTVDIKNNSEDILSNLRQVTPPV